MKYKKFKDVINDKEEDTYTLQLSKDELYEIRFALNDLSKKAEEKAKEEKAYEDYFKFIEYLRRRIETLLPETLQGRRISIDEIATHTATHITEGFYYSNFNMQGNIQKSTKEEYVNNVMNYFKTIKKIYNVKDDYEAILINYEDYE
jgi:hypothetical protein